MSKVVGASIDVGSNSVHILVAAIEDHQLKTLADASSFLGLGRAIVERHHLGAAARGELVEVLTTYVAQARSLGASSVTIVGTEPIRRAGDGVTVVSEVESGVGIPLHVITHEEEAFLTAIGVTAGRPVGRETLILDVGGGSSEFCLVGPDGPPRAMGLRLGSDRLTRHHVQHDPPTADELGAMLTEARMAVEALPDGHPGEIVAVGGTVSNLLKVVRDGATEGELSRDETARALQLLTAEPAEMSARRHNIKPIRARILPAGAVIVDAILGRFGAGSLRVSDAGMREGAILVADHAGRAWRDKLPGLARGWRESATLERESAD